MDEWDSFISGTFLKATNVENEEQPFIVMTAEPFMDERDGTIRLRTSVEAKGTKFLFDVNKTNGVFLKNSGLLKPRDVIGKNLYFKKVQVRNPTTNQEVEGLRILKVE